MDKTEAVRTAIAILSEARASRPGSGAKLIIVLSRHNIEPQDIGSTKNEIKKIARNAIIERTLVLMSAANIFQLDFDLLIAAADFTSSQRTIAERLKRSGPTKTLIEEAKAFDML